MNDLLTLIIMLVVSLGVLGISACMRSSQISREEERWSQKS